MMIQPLGAASSFFQSSSKLTYHFSVLRMQSVMTFPLHTPHNAGIILSIRILIAQNRFDKKYFWPGAASFVFEM
jgi:hypothetical protein